MKARDIPIVYAKAGGDPGAIRAQWSGLPSGQREFIEDVIEACCWRADSSIWHVAVAAALETALASEATLGAIAERGRAFALEHHDPDVHFDRMLRTVDAFLEKTGGLRG